MIVLDCSAAVAIVRETLEGNALRALMLENETTLTSEMFVAEVRNSFWKYVRAQLMTIEEAEFYIEKAIGLVDEFVPLKENADEAFAEAVRQNHSVYDMFYLTLVRRSARTLFSLDKKLVKLCMEMKLDCVKEVAL